MGAELLPSSGGWSGGRTDVTELTLAFRSFEKTRLKRNQYIQISQKVIISCTVCRFLKAGFKNRFFWINV